MLLNCPTCGSAIEAGPLPPGAMASCPFCQGMFQVPAEIAPLTEMAPTILAPTILAPTVIEPAPLAPTVAMPAVAPEPEEMPIIVREPVVSADTRVHRSSLSATLLWALIFFGAFAVIGGGVGYAVFLLAKSQEPKIKPPTAQAPAAPDRTDEPPARPAASAKATPQDEAVANWRMLLHFTGGGQRNTPHFRTTKPRWRIRWIAKARDATKADNFALNVADGTGKQVKTPVSIVGGGSDTAYVSTRPGFYRVEVFTFDTDWELAIEEPE